MAAGGESQVVEVDGRRVRLTSLDKVVYPATGTTKAEVIDYLARVADPLLAQLAGRPVTRVRWPHGTGRASFFEKNTPAGAPSWLRTATLPASPSSTGPDGAAGGAGPAEEEGEPGEVLRYPVLEDAAGLVWAGNLGALELHTPQWRVDAPGRPDRLVVDLDPGPGTGLAECAALAAVVAERLADDGLEAVPVTSGSKGLQLYAAVSGEQDAAVVRAYVRRLAESLAHDRPREVTATMTRSVRQGKVLLDWSQNAAAKTTITPYSLRGKESPTAAAPRSWAEVDEHLTQLAPSEVVGRLEALGDLMPPVQVAGPRLPEG